MSTQVEILSRTNLNALSRDERKALVKKTYQQKSYFQELFGYEHQEFTCEKNILSLRQQIERLLKERNIIDKAIPLETLHEHVSEEMKAYNFDDGVNKLSTYFYETDDLFMQSYYQLICFIREHVIKEPFWFQATPTIRIHCPNGKNGHHYPRYHTDIGYGHPPEEINIWLPLTDVLDGHGFRIATLANSTKILGSFEYDFINFIEQAIKNPDLTKECESLSEAVTTPLGNIFAFDSRCVHTGEPLKTHTRASLDIRVLPVSQYENMQIEYQGSGRRKIIFAPGHCYHEKHSDYFLNR